ncbi:hypothetical protein [Devosia sp.]|uniref:hypothetical protein n=1 Tax=Devosia sp. TaxID=1871048 RepID=UPI0027357AE1|nr:hypothetical protein [Devosia sp.]MDP2781756.1 hypothetical protein [Devosia sp.]
MARRAVICANFAANASLSIAPIIKPCPMTGFRGAVLRYAGIARFGPTRLDGHATPLDWARPGMASQSSARLLQILEVWCKYLTTLCFALTRTVFRRVFRYVYTDIEQPYVWR